MNYLLDTPTCIWAVGKRAKLSNKVKNILQDSKNVFWISKISLLEIAIKLKIGKLEEFNVPLSEFIQSLYISGYLMLPVKDKHLETYSVFDFEETHRNSFDRYILATAMAENFAIITKDEKFQFYRNRLEIIW